MPHNAAVLSKFHGIDPLKILQFYPSDGMHLVICPLVLCFRFPDNLLVPSYTPWRPDSLVDTSVLPKKTTQ